MQSNDYFVEIYPLAQKDIENIYQYYYEQSLDIEVAVEIVTKLKKSILGLSHMPKSHPEAQEPRLKKDGFRKLICGQFVIPFLIDEQQRIVSIVRVFHGKMNYQQYL